MKTKQIGVRFDQSLLDELKRDGKADTPQKALNYLTDLYRVSGIVDFTPLQKQEPKKLSIPEMVKKNEEKLMSKYDLERRMKKNDF